ncbi:MAG: hypothetical protein CM1200mP30_22090 [Pseudomonadota bacterium]|nr:MAG: hypothetical protein CM1200mP30_22090 [Pseudomonadota bacterium]
MKDTPPVVEASKVDLVFQTADGPVHALSDIDLEINKGDFISLIGPSGCGKTTLLRLIADLEKPTGGMLKVNGISPEEARLNRNYGYVFQSPALYPWRTVEGNLKLPLEIMGVEKAEQNKRAREALEMVDLTDFEKKFPWQLSGGMQQRVSIARALTFYPDLLLMDEPFGALDEIVRDQLNEHFHRLWEQTHKTVVFVTHSIPEAAYLSTKIVVMSPRPGKINDIIENTLPEKRSLDIRETQEFLELSQRIRKGLRQDTFIIKRNHETFANSTLAAITAVMAFIVVIWYGAAVYLNSDVLIDKYERQKTEWNFQLLVSDSWSMGRPVLPAPHQIMKDMNKSLFEYKITSKRSLVYHGWVTISSTLVGFVMGGVLGILLAIGIVHVPTLIKASYHGLLLHRQFPFLLLHR